MTYICLFDSNGYRLITYPIDKDMTDERKSELLSKGYIEISDADYNYYAGNMGGGANGTGYIRGKDGKPTDAPPAPEPTPDEKIAALDADYNRQKQDLINEYTDAQIHGDTDTVALVQQEMSALDEWYDEEYRKIEKGEAE